ncbi:MAG TPA: ACT domain-containing protein [Propionibacteriaceae bacterium]
MMRVSLPDRPGSLGAVATAMGRVGGDINAVEIVEKGDGVVVDDFIVDLPPNQLPETIVTACQTLEGVRVEWISRYPEGGGLQSDLEALERMTADPTHAAETLVSLCPVVFRSHWATLIQVAPDGPHSTFSTTLAPDVTPTVAESFGPFDVTHRKNLASGWSPGWGDTTVVVTPLTQDRVIAIGRLGGPAFLDSEIARLHHLAALVK